MGGDGFAEWYQENYRRVFASVLMVSGDHGAAADAVDEAFARALERWSRVRAMDSPSGWTFTVARNLLRRGRDDGRRQRAVKRRRRQLSRKSTSRSGRPCAPCRSASAS